ncbi:MAG: cytochrome c [Microthrixaceae bacterium]|nr:cytochrome c [Microthrixaceae bacterium]
MSTDNGQPRSERRTPSTVLAMTVMAMSLLLAACGSEGATAGPDAEQIAQGEELYQANCASCHGSDLRGTDKGPSHLSSIYEPGHHGDNAFRSAIEIGAVQHHWPFGDMPPVPGLSSTEVDAIIAYVREVQEREGLE